MVSLLGPSGGKLGQPRIVRYLFGQDRAAFRGFVEGLAAIDGLRLLTMSHGAPVHHPGQALREAATRL